MRKAILLLFFLISISTHSQAQSFKIQDGVFLLNDTPMRIYGGEMHYPRIPREYWRHRIQMAKAMGCNALSIYVFWNYHETAPGVWDWHSDNHDLRAFVETARSEGMYIILRPGPYVCAEWDFGGFPYWMVDMKLRTADPAFIDSCRTYLRQVYQQLDGLFIEQGGNILMTQVENEYGFFALATGVSKRNADTYKKAITDIYREVGFNHTLFTCDGGIIPIINFARMGHIQGLFPGTNDSKFLSTARHTVHHYFDKKGPYYIPEEYAGWFTHWGDAHVFHRDVDKYKTHIEQLLKTDFSFCYYMIHGGTNFGFMNGANSSPKHEVYPVITSYDYGAPIDEAGNAIPLYDSLRAVYMRVTNRALPPVPAPIASMAIDKIQLTGQYSLLEIQKGFETIAVNQPKTFEQLKQPFGYLIYEKQFSEKTKGRLSTQGIMDYAQIYLNDSLVGIIDRTLSREVNKKQIALDIPRDGILKILVENTGRINFGKKLLANSKGITNGISIDGKAVYDWTIYKLPTDNVFVPSFMSEIDYVIARGYSLYAIINGERFRHHSFSYHSNLPIYYTGSFTLTHTADTYLNMKGFGKGVVFVNGHNLGRYWEIGPQFSLYVPGVWLKEGGNEIIIFDMLNHSQQHYISATAKPMNN